MYYFRIYIDSHDRFMVTFEHQGVAAFTSAPFKTKDEALAFINLIRKKVKDAGIVDDVTINQT